MTSAFVMVAAMSLFSSSLKTGSPVRPGEMGDARLPAEFELTVRVPTKFIPLQTQGSPLGPLVADSKVTRPN
jgi:hypothetical protein